MIKNNFHRLLRRQIKDHLGQLEVISKADLDAFLEVVNSAYKDYDQDIAHIENILSQSSHELFKKNKELNKVNSNLSVTIDKKTAHLTKASYNLKNAEKLAKLGNFTWDIDSRQLDLSDQLISMFDQHKIDFSKGIKKILKNFENGDEITKTIFKSVKQKGNFKIEKARLINDAVYFHIEGRVIQNNKEGSLLIGIFQDISNTIIAEEKNQELKLFYETILNSLPPNVLVFDRKQNYLLTLRQLQTHLSVSRLLAKTTLIVLILPALTSPLPSIRKTNSMMPSRRKKKLNGTKPLSAKMAAKDPYSNTWFRYLTPTIMLSL